MNRFIRVFTSMRMFVLLLLGFSSGLPLALTGDTLNAWMASEKLDLKTIGLFSLVSLPYSIKFIWAPILDRFELPLLGRRRGWMLLSQLLLAISIAAMGFMDPQRSLSGIAACAVVVAFLSATQDIVIDAFRPESLNKEEYGAGASTAILGYRIAMLVSGAVALILSDRYSWKYVYILMSLGMVVGIIATLLAQEPEISHSAPKSLREAAIDPIAEFFSRFGLLGALQVFLFILLYKMDVSLMGGMTNPFLLQLGFTKTDIGVVKKGVGMIATIVGSIAGGAAMIRLGLFRSLLFFGVFHAGTNLLFAALSIAGKNHSLMVAAFGIDNFFGGMGAAAYAAFLMSLCNQRFTAFQYAALSSLMALTGKIAGAVSGLLAESLGWTGFFIVSSFGGIPAIILLILRFKTWKMESKSA